VWNGLIGLRLVHFSQGEIAMLLADSASIVTGGEASALSAGMSMVQTLGGGIVT
jgi:hypothetical protein